MMAPLTCLEAVGGFDEHLPASEWADLSFRLAQRYEFDTVEANVVTIHRAPGPRQWASYNRIVAGYILLTKYTNGIPARRRFRATPRLHLSVAHLKLGESSAARKQLIASLMLYPRLRTFAYLILTFDGGRFYEALGRLKRRLISLRVG